MKNNENAYFTVEAAMVLPIVLGVIVLLIYLVLFQYNRCLMEQDMGALALKGCMSCEEDKEALLRELKGYADELYQEKYIAWEQDDVKIELSGNEVEVSQKGLLKFPFAGWVGGNISSGWDAGITYTNQKVNPVDYLRAYRKLKGGN